MHDRDFSSFKTTYMYHYLGLSFEVYNSFLPQLASKLRAVESVSPKKCLNYDDLCSKMHLFEALFLDFQIQQLAILKPVEVGKSYIPQKKAL